MAARESFSDRAVPTLPEGTRLVHIGPPKTGTTALQGAFHVRREELHAQGVHYAGRSRHSRDAVLAVMGRKSIVGEAPGPRMRKWHGLVRDISSASGSRVVLSSESFAGAEPEAIRRIVGDLDPSRVHVAVTLRPIARIIPSQWQQNVQAGSVVSYDAWLQRLFDPVPGRENRSFWHRQRHDQLIARWAEVVGPENVTVVVLDEHDHGMVLRTFERLVGLREGTLVAEPDLANRSLTLPEVEAIRAFNVAFKAEGLGTPLHVKVMLMGAAQHLKRQQPNPEWPRIDTPGWALERAGETAREMVDGIAASGVRVVGDLESLAVVPTSRLAGDRQPRVEVPPEIAASMAMGILVATGAARRAKARGALPAEPLELARVPTYQVAGVLVRRARNAAVGRWRRLRRRVIRVLRRAA